MTDNNIVQIGRYLYRCRAVIAVSFFIGLLVCSRPAHSPHILPSLLIAAGLLMRIWAAGYIGTQSRKHEFCADFIITNGPYRYIKHPLYLGNFLLVVGVALLFNPPLQFILLVVVLFIIEYSIIIYSELNFLKSLTKKDVEFKLVNVKGEVFTILTLLIIYLIYLGSHILTSE